MPVLFWSNIFLSRGSFRNQEKEESLLRKKQVLSEESGSPKGESCGHRLRKSNRLARKYSERWVKAPKSLLYDFGENTYALNQDWIEKLILTVHMPPRHFIRGSKHKDNIPLGYSDLNYVLQTPSQFSSATIWVWKPESKALSLKWTVEIYSKNELLDKVVQTDIKNSPLSFKAEVGFQSVLTFYCFSYPFWPASAPISTTPMNVFSVVPAFKIMDWSFLPISWCIKT